MRTVRAWPFAATLLLGACGIGGDTISIDGVTIDESRLEALLVDLADTDQITISDGRASGDEVRSVLEVLLRIEAIDAVLAEAGESITAEDEAVVREQLESDPSIETVGETLIEVVLRLNSADLALDRIEVPADDELARRYEERPASLGALCVRHLVVETREEAAAALREVRGGADFADVAARVSIEPAAATSGGALGSEDNPCLRLVDYQESFDPQFTEGVLQARPGVAYGPVRSSFGWHVVYVRPFDEVADGLRSLLGAEAGQLLVTGHLATADITVPSRIGRWFPAQGRVVARP